MFDTLSSRVQRHSQVDGLELMVGWSEEGIAVRLARSHSRMSIQRVVTRDCNPSQFEREWHWESDWSRRPLNRLDDHCEIHGNGGT